MLGSASEDRGTACQPGFLCDLRSVLLCRKLTHSRMPSGKDRLDKRNESRIATCTRCARSSGLSAGRSRTLVLYLSGKAGPTLHGSELNKA